MKKWSVIIAALMALLVLALSPMSVLAHGGTVEAKSDPGEGAEFIVRLPAILSDSPA